jgi:hypothetical protein
MDDDTKVDRNNNVRGVCVCVCVCVCVYVRPSIRFNFKSIKPEISNTINQMSNTNTQ